MKKVQIISIYILIVTLVVMAANRIIVPLPDWIIRMDGIIMLAALFSCFLQHSKTYEKEIIN